MIELFFNHFFFLSKMSKEKKFVVVGKYGSGKTTLLYFIVMGTFLDGDYDCWDDSYRKQIVVDGESFMTEFLDTHDEEYSALRDQHTHTGDGFLVVYSIADRSTFEEVKPQIEEIYRVRDETGTAIVLVGNKCDLEDKRQVTTEEGRSLAESYGIPFFEISVKTSLNVNEAVEALIRRCEEYKLSKENDNDGGSGSDGGKKCIIQ